VRRAGLLALAFLASLLGLQPVRAAGLEWGATVQGRVGYGSNPFLDQRGNAGTGLVGATVAPVLRWREPTAVTELSGSYNRNQYFSRYGNADDYTIDLRRNQQVSAKLSVNAHVGYFSSISGGLLSPYYDAGPAVTGPVGVDAGTIGGSLNTGAGGLGAVGGALGSGSVPSGFASGPVIINPGTVDRLAVGARQRRLSGDAGFNWQPTARDNIHASVLAERDTFTRFGGDYDYLSANAGYLRTLDARTSVGFDVTVGRVYSRAFPDSSSVQPSVTVQRRVGARWTLNAGVGAIIASQRGDGEIRRRTTVTPGFNASLCGEYPRASVCLSASRTAAPSGIGGLRRQTQFGVNGTFRLTERSRLIGAATYGISDSGNAVLINGVRYGNQRFALARLDYQRDLSRRISAGVGGSYQARSGAGLSDVHALAITFNLTARLGRLS